MRLSDSSVSLGEAGVTQRAERTVKLRGEQRRFLWDRERAVAEMLVQGLKPKRISEMLKLSLNTVETYIYQIYIVLGIHSRKDLKEAYAAERAAYMEHLTKGARKVATDVAKA